MLGVVSLKYGKPKIFNILRFVDLTNNSRYVAASKINVYVLKQVSILFQWQSIWDAPGCPIVSVFLYNVHILLNLFSSWTCKKYLRYSLSKLNQLCILRFKSMYFDLRNQFFFYDRLWIQLHVTPGSVSPCFLSIHVIERSAVV